MLTCFLDVVNTKTLVVVFLVFTRRHLVSIMQNPDNCRTVLQNKII